MLGAVLGDRGLVGAQRDCRRQAPDSFEIPGLVLVREVGGIDTQPVMTQVRAMHVTRLSSAVVGRQEML